MSLSFRFWHNFGTCASKYGLAGQVEEIAGGGRFRLMRRPWADGHRR